MIYYKLNILKRRLENFVSFNLDIFIHEEDIAKVICLESGYLTNGVVIHIHRTFYLVPYFDPTSIKNLP